MPFLQRLSEPPGNHGRESFYRYEKFVRSIAPDSSVYQPNPYSALRINGKRSDAVIRQPGVSGVIYRPFGSL